jgi:exopolysaccharide biosynthesis polyprenyl glycosylphosphotransferase
MGVGDAFLVPLAYAGAYFIRFGAISLFKVHFSPVFLLMMTAGYLAVFYFFDLYALYRKTRARTLAARIALAVVASAFIASILKYIFFLYPIGRGVLVIANTMLVVLIFIWRKAGIAVFRLIGKPSPVLIVGKGKGADEIADIIRTDPGDYQIIGISAGERLADVLESGDIKIIVMTDSAGAGSLSAEEILLAHHRAVEVIDVSEMYQRLKFRIPIDYIKDESCFLKTKGFSLANNNLVGKIKRAFDVALAGILFVVGLPLWPIIALLIKIESRGPVFYRQRRVGKNGVGFLLHKFRSMVENAEDEKAVWAREDDQRVTRIGRILRALHLDELPQLWNVLRGEMSLVGPRPERPEFVAGLQRDIPFYTLRHFVKPGLTGWAQINYPYAASTKDSKEKLEFDLYYISRMSLIFDLKILIETLAGVFSSRRREN